MVISSSLPLWGIGGYLSDLRQDVLRLFSPRTFPISTMKTEKELIAAIDAELDRDLLISIFGLLPEESRRSIARSMNEAVLRRNHVIHQELVDESAREISGRMQQQDIGAGPSRASELTKELSLRQRAWDDLRDRLKL